MQRVDEPHEVQAVADALQDATRDQPWVVVTHPTGATEPAFDVDDLAAQVAGHSNVVVLASVAATYRLSSLLPDGTSAYGGAVRVYPPGDAWLRDPWASRFFLIRDADDARRLLPAVVATVLRHGSTHRESAASTRVDGVVTGFPIPGQTAFVQLENGRFVPVHAELLHPDVPIEWMLHTGQRVSGALDAGGRLTLATHPMSELLVLQRFPDGVATLAIVAEVGVDHLVARLHPDVTTRVTRGSITSNPADRVDDYYSVGDVVPVRVRHRKGRLRLSLDDVDELDDLTAPFALLDGGRPWLELGRDGVDDSVALGFSAGGADAVGADALSDADAVLDLADDDVTAERAERAEPGASEPQATEQVSPTLPSPARVAAASAREVTQPPAADNRSALQTAQLTITQQKAEIARLRVLVARLEASHGDADVDRMRERVALAQQELRDVILENGELKHKVRELQERSRGAKTRLRAAASTRTSGAGIAVHGDEEWVRASIWLEWMRSLTPDDRRESPLPEYEVGAAFASSLRQHDERVHAKAFRCAMLVLTGRDGAAQAGHALKQGEAGQPTVRADGATCIRYYVEQNTPSARRLHVWRGDAGALELSRVVLHDDYAP